MAHTIKISDGSVTADFLGTDYKFLIDRWSPRVATRRRDSMAGRSPYNDVVESVGIQVSGTSESDCLANLQTLSELFDQANAWRYDSDGNTAVYIEYEPPNSGLANSVKAVLWDARIELPRNFAYIFTDGRYKIGVENDPITITFTRRGLWLGATETESSSASSGNPATLTSSAFTDTAAILWPYTVEIDCDATSGGMQASDVWLLFQNAAAKLYNLEAESFTQTTNASSTVVSGSSNGSVSRFQASTATTGSTITDNLTAPNLDGRAIAVYAVVRNNSTTGTGNVDWSIWAEVSTFSTTIVGKKTIIAASDNDRQVIKLGLFYFPDDVDTIVIKGTGSANGSNGTDDLDVDYICAVAMDDSTGIVQATTAAQSADSEIHIDHRLTSHRDPLVWQSNSGGSTITYYPGRDGDPILAVTSNVIACLVFGVTSDGGDWTLQDSSNNEMNFTLNVTRTKAYLTPL